MAITVETIHAAPGDEALLQLLATELQQLLPIEIQEDREQFHQILGSLPRGLRAMAGTHEFNVSMAQEDLAAHFNNQNDERDLRETLHGLQELELPQVADLFDQAWKIMEPNLDTLRKDEVSLEKLHDWLDEIGVQEKIDPMNDMIWDISADAGPLGLHQAWVLYARKYPERCVVAEA
jgi:hypothetical protein